MTDREPDPIERMVYAYIDAYPEATISPMTAYVAALDRKIDPNFADPQKIQDIREGMLAAVRELQKIAFEPGPMQATLQTDRWLRSVLTERRSEGKG